MKKIYKIKKNKNKYTIILNDNTSFSFYSDTLVKYNLLKPRVISDEEFEEIINYNNYTEAYNVALKYLTLKLRTKKEVERKLNEYSKDVVENVINKLEKLGYLNEIKYIEAFINDQITLGNKGPVYIIKELEKLGLDNNLILEEINKINEDIWIEKVEKIIDKRKKSNKLSKKMFVLKTKAYLNNLGYYKKTIDEVINCIEINEDVDVIKNEYEKVKRKLSRKYEGQKLKEKIKLSLYNKGYNLENILEIINNDLEK